jgi:1-deoxy-D-xylulose-5-phosphate synthase
MAFEALNHVGALKQNLTVVLNDNEMSIGRTSGAMAGYLNRVITGQMYNRMRDDAWNLLGLLPRDISDRARHAARKLEEGLKNLVVPSLLFEELGFRYIGPVDGHNLPELLATFRRVRELHGPVLVHAVTRKGRGYKFAVEDPERFHGTGPFDCDSGRALGGGVTSFTSTFGHTLVELAERDNRVAAITAGMCLGTGLAEFRSRYPDRFFDVGIAEQHAVTFGAGLAQAGMRPVVAVYSTFLTRALDQVVQDVALQRLPVVLAVDRAGLVGEDGPTHHGMFDLTYLSMVPGLAIMAPRDEGMLELMLRFGVLYEDGPVAIRYPRGSTAGDSRLPVDGREGRSELRMGKAEVLREGGDGCVAAVGSMVLPAVQAADDLSLAGLRLTVVDVRFVKPLDEELFCRLAERFGRMVTVEEGVLAGGFGSCVQAALQARGFSRTEVLRIGLPDRFVEHGSRASLLQSVGLTAKGLAVRFEQLFRTGGPSRKAEV